MLGVAGLPWLKADNTVIYWEGPGWYGSCVREGGLVEYGRVVFAHRDEDLSHAARRLGLGTPRHLAAPPSGWTVR